MVTLLALASSALWGTADFLGGYASRKAPAVVVVIGSQLVALLVLVPLVLAAGALDGARRGLVTSAAAAGLVGLVALVAFYRALAVGTMGVVAPIAALGVAVPVVAGLVDGERPGARAAVGAVVATVGVVLAGGPDLRSGPLRRSGGGALAVGLAVVAAVGFGGVLLLVARAVRAGEGGTGDVLLLLACMRATAVGAGAVGVAVLAVGRARQRLVAQSWSALPWSALPRSALPVVAVIGVADAAANATYAFATRTGLVSTTAVLASLYPVVTVLLARQLLRERLLPVQAIGAALALTGAALLAA